MRFVDEVSIKVRSGDGGKGCVSFKRTKCIPRGGPDGGDGGKGGDVIFRADPQLSTLENFLSRKTYHATSGESGKSKNQHGKNSSPLILTVPLGTVVQDAHTQEILSEIIHPHQEFVVAKGGEGGKGNAFFATSTHQAPQFSQEGRKSEEKELLLELKLFTDVVIIGQPSSGKSSLLSKITSATPKIADYPFTTQQPCPGTWGDKYEEKLLMVELPGIVKGSHQGCGLGLRFLRHAERARCLLYLLDLSNPIVSPLEVFHLLEEELSAYNPSLFLEKLKVVVLNKEDIQNVMWNIYEIVRYFKNRNIKTFIISALTGKGIESVISFLQLRKGNFQIAPPS
jgi:GTP-binding protein